MDIQRVAPRRPNVRIERIVSHGHASPDGFWYDQEQHEVVVLLPGAARLRFEDEVIDLKPGSFIDLPAHRRHRLEWTTPDEPIVWLAIHYGEYSTMRTFLVLLLLCSPLCAAEPKVQPKKQTAEFKWVTPLPEGRHPGLRHATFDSPSNGVTIGYCIYLPPGYDDPKNQDRRYPVVYWLHGGRPGGELKGVSITPFIHDAINNGKIQPMIYVFPNGGAVSHYDYPKLKSLGETAFIKELIPHVDRTYRTIAAREGRAVEGFSQGGRGTARYMLKYPELFCSAAPMGGGHQHEKRISENDGDEGDYQFEPKHNTYDLARKYAADAKCSLRIMVVVGDKDKNYEANLEWMDHLRSLKIPFEHRIVAGVPHSTQLVYEKVGLDVMKFHAENFKNAQPNGGK